MSSEPYNWKRFWYPRGKNISLADRGYLDDPTSKYGLFLNSNVVPFESLATIPCLALLGEPGIGKTKAIEAALKAIDSGVKEKGTQTLSLDLRSYGSEDRLVRKLFESQTFISWIQGTHRLYLFLDSLDECLLRINTLTTLLIDELKEYCSELERLYLRITCRTADWPNSLEEGLKQLWGQKSVGVYELAPLRRVDKLSCI